MRYDWLTKPGFLVYLERFLLGFGVLGLLFVGMAYLDSALVSRQAMAAFDEALSAQEALEALKLEEPDQSLWSESRKKKYTELTSDKVPLAVLAIDRLKLQVPVFPGTDRLTLNRGAGIVDGTAYPGEKGNMVVSAHRDGFFRPLKDIAVGDQIKLKTLKGTQVFVVKELFITDPLDISVLDPTDSQTLTLITCYPFYYVGYAPERLIIRALPEQPNDDSRNDIFPKPIHITNLVTSVDTHPDPNTHGVLNYSQ
ncbi:class D sortase [Aestuariicella hydrocarbonica]|uniref:Class D sortase n=1 Tax=Pseudomaricurvus hydrocarbonicus TaxID=1470433 RepID=A0A9E5JSK1_9GAMM|nr:class D sortase [Aestuariicella hydrocarbonica]NHO64105.1 class D sortase [Aestuariicella hydrocarbonica]